MVQFLSVLIVLSAFSAQAEVVLYKVTQKSGSASLALVLEQGSVKRSTDIYYAQDQQSFEKDLRALGQLRSSLSCQQVGMVQESKRIHEHDGLAHSSHLVPVLVQGYVLQKNGQAVSESLSLANCEEELYSVISKKMIQISAKRDAQMRQKRISDNINANRSRIN